MISLYCVSSYSFITSTKHSATHARSKARAMTEHPRLAGARHVKLTNTATCFWRYHTRDTSHEGVCTLEAVYFFLRELCTRTSGRHRGTFLQGPGAGGEGALPRGAEGPGREAVAAGDVGPSSAEDPGERKGASASACPCYDDLLWYYLFQHAQVATVYRDRAGRAQLQPASLASGPDERSPPVP